MTNHNHSHYFANCITLADLKSEYHRLAKLHHPDAGGDTATMQAINADFDRLWSAYQSSEPRQTTPHETAQDVRRDFYTANGWAGSNYDSSMSLKEIAAAVRRYIKTTYPRYKFSVRTYYASLCQGLSVELKEAPIPIYKTIDELTETDRHQIRHRACNSYSHDWTLGSWTPEEERAEILRLWATGKYLYYVLSDEIQTVADDVDRLINSYNYNDSDAMIDYFDTNFYFNSCLERNGANIKYVPRPDPTAKKTKAQNKTNTAPTKTNKTTKTNTAPAEITSELPKTPAEQIAARFRSFQGITVTIKGAQTDRPVIWLSGEVARHTDELKATGARWSQKREAYYVRVA